MIGELMNAVNTHINLDISEMVNFQVFSKIEAAPYFFLGPFFGSQ